MICKVCGKEYENLSKGKKCRVCEYKSNHKIICNELWSLEEQETILDMVLNYKIETLEEILPFIKNKTLEQLIELLETNLKIGNRPMSIKLKCSHCGKEIIRVKRFLKYDRVYCDMKCRDEYSKKHKTKQGENNGSYNSVNVECKCCGKTFKTPKHKLSLVNEKGENNLFCSRKCYSQFRSEHYVGENGANFGNKMTEEQIEQNRQRALKMIADGAFPQTLTKPHIKTNHVLEKLNITYTNEKVYKYYSLDIFLDDSGLMIEVMGDYFHSNPLKYKIDELNSTQKKGKAEIKVSTHILKNIMIQKFYIYGKVILTIT